MIQASSDAGMFYGTRTVLQLLSWGSSLPRGIVKDKPAYERRGLLLDVARKFASVEEVKDWIRLMGWYKFNELHFHLNDNSWGRYPGYRLQSDAFPGLASEDGHYPWEEIEDLQDFAQARGITIFPEIDAPGHSLPFTLYNPELAHPDIGREGFGLAYLDVRNPQAIRFMEQLIDEVAPRFRAAEFHIGTDEYRIGEIPDPKDKAEAGELFRQWINHFATYLEENHGKVPRIWSGYEHLPGTTQPKTSIVIDMWETVDARAKTQAGYRVVNSSHYFTYIVPGAPYYGVNNERVYSSWTPLIFANQEGAILEAGDPGLLGGKLHIWNDFGPTGYTWNEIVRLCLPSMAVFGDKLWAAGNDGDYSSFRPLAQQLAAAVPAVSITRRLAAAQGDTLWSFRGDRSMIANSSIPTGIQAQNLEWPWRASFTITRRSDSQGSEVLMASQLATIYLDLSHNFAQGDAQPLQKRGLAIVRANQAPGYEPLLSHRPDVLVFDYQVPLREKVTLTLVGEERKTSLYVNGAFIQSFPIQTVCPLQSVGAWKLPQGFHGTIHEISITTDE